jgi:hypothetical protein
MMPVVFDGEPAPGLSCVSARITGLLARAAMRIAFATASATGCTRCAANCGSAASTASARRFTARSTVA